MTTRGIAKDVNIRKRWRGAEAKDQELQDKKLIPAIHFPEGEGPKEKKKNAFLGGVGNSPGTLCKRKTRGKRPKKEKGGKRKGKDTKIAGENKEGRKKDKLETIPVSTAKGW